MIHILPVLHTARIQLFFTLRRPAFRFVTFIQPFVIMLITYFMLAQTARDHFLAYSILGSGLAGLWSSIIYSSAGDIERERSIGTLEMLFISPTSFGMIMLGKVLGNMLLGLTSFALSFFYGYFIFRVRLHIHHFGLFLLGLVFLVISCTLLSLVMAPLFTLSRRSSAFVNGLEYPLFLLSGALYPTELLPKWLQPISYCLSPSWATKLLRSAFQNTFDIAVVSYEVLWLIAVNLSYLILMYLLFRYMERRVRIAGTLGVE